MRRKINLSLVWFSLQLLRLRGLVKYENGGYLLTDRGKRQVLRILAEKKLKEQEEPR